jgi:hypothetical protein
MASLLYCHLYDHELKKLTFSPILYSFSMGDITKAGSNRGYLKRELEDILRFAKMTYQRYVLTIKDYTRDELEGDLKEYTLQLENFVVPLLERAEEEGLEDIAKEIEGYYKKLIDAIKQRLLEI